MMRPIIKKPLVRRLQAWRLGASYLGSRGVVLQQKRNDCGLAALQMILERFGVQVAAEELKALVRLQPRGATLSSLGHAAEEFGLRSYGWKLYPEDLNLIAFPFLAWLKQGHYVVVERLLKDGSLVVLDPALGRLRFRSGSFWNHWRGEALLFSLEGGRKAVAPSQANMTPDGTTSCTTIS